MAVSIRVDKLNRTFGKVNAITDLSFEVPKGSFVTLLGPSGCGKTTTLRCLAGLDSPDNGSIWFGERLMFGHKTNVPAKDRGVGMVFQSYAIWPHMRVFDNIAYGLNGRHISTLETKKRVEHIAEVVGIEGLLTRYPSQLSGGQQQRVSLARSLVYEPNVLLLDEPLSNLDAKLRNKMRFELAELQQRLETTAVYVTHNKSEALVMSDYVLLMKDGQAVQFGTPEELYNRPANVYAADFLGETNFIDGTVDVVPKDSFISIRTSEGLKLLATGTGKESIGSTVAAMVRLHNVQISPKPHQIANNLEAVVEYAAFAGENRELRLKVQGLSIRGNTNLPVTVGEKVYIGIRPEDLLILECNSTSATLGQCKATEE
jgi:ABC-type Fe3+/spermidine/putrescine transport system ATPase subunit